MIDLLCTGILSKSQAGNIRSKIGKARKAFRPEGNLEIRMGPLWIWGGRSRHQRLGIVWESSGVEWRVYGTTIMWPSPSLDGEIGV